MKKLKDLVISLELDPKKEIIKFSFIAIGLVALGVALYFVTKSMYAVIATIVSIPIFAGGFIYRYTIYANDKRRRLESEFLEVFSYIRIYLVNKETVYEAIKRASEYTSKEMSKEINEFLQ